MTEELSGAHHPWDELVAAHALHALEPDDELLLLAHVDCCGSCRDRLDGFTLVAAQLGSLTDGTVDPPAWSAIRPPSHGSAAPPPAADVARVLPLRRRMTSRALSAAAAAVVAAGVAAVGWQLSPAGPSASSAALTACRQQSGCRIIQVHGQGGDAAAVLVEAGRASLVPVHITVPPDGRMYVLWQLPRDGSPIPVVTFHDTTRQTSSVPLVTGYSDTAAFAVSVEADGPMPTHPTDVLAVGAANG
ncbi:MAG TPA: anti-sigma factor [Mycobacteriales bacterium]|nr:anti-sigma factor [Mycobacteriales bacterium]